MYLQGKSNKIIAIILIVLLLWSDFAFLGIGLISMAQEMNNAEIIASSQITKYIPQNNQVIIQEAITISVKEETLEGLIVQNTKITYEVPKYQGIRPERVDVYTEKMQATKGNGVNTFSNNDYNYDANTGILTITVENEEQNITSGEDIYYITYYYGKNAYDKYIETTHINEYEDAEIEEIYRDEHTKKVKVKIKQKEEIDLGLGLGISIGYKEILVDLDTIEYETNKNIEMDIKVREDTNKLQKELKGKTTLDLLFGADNSCVVFNIPSKIQKGEIFVRNETNIETLKYTEKRILSHFENSTEFKMSDKGDALKTKSGDIVNLEESTFYKKTIIAQKDVEQLLGNQGYIYIQDEDYNYLYKITASHVEILDTETTEEQIDETSSEEIKKPITVGTINADSEGNYVIEYIRQICNIILTIKNPAQKGILKISNEKEISNSLKVEVNDDQLIKNFVVYGNVLSYVQSEIDLENQITKASLKINNTEWNVVNKNEGVEFEISLNNSSPESDFWGSTRLIIELPKEIENVEINGFNIIYQDELEISKVSNIEMNGHQAIEVVLTGIQKQYISESIIKGTTIIVNTNIELNELSATTKDNEVKLYYYNSMATEYDNLVNVEINNEKMDMGYTSAMVNYIAPLTMQCIQQITNFDENGTVINSMNVGHNVGKIGILEESKTVNVKLNIINNTGNKCTDVIGIGRIPFKNNQEIETGKDLGTTVTTQIEELLKEVETSGKNITIYYSENGNATVDLDNELNAWSTEIKDKSKICSYMIVVEELAEAEKIELSYSFKIPANLEHGEYLYSTFGVYFVNNEAEKPVSEKKIASSIGLTTGEGARISATTTVSIGDGNSVHEGQKIKYDINIVNTGSIDITDLVVEDLIPEGSTFVKQEKIENDINTRLEYIYYENANKLVWDIGEFKQGESITISFEVEVNRLPTILEYYGSMKGFITEDDKYYLLTPNTETGIEEKVEINDIPEIILKNYATITCSSIEKEIKTNEVSNKVVQIDIKVTEESSVNQAKYVEENEELNYNVMIYNVSAKDLKNITVNKIVPQGLTLKATTLDGEEIEYKYDEETRTVSINIANIPAYAIYSVQIYVVANKLAEDEYEKEITTNTEININDEEKIYTSSVTNIIAKPRIITDVQCDILNRYIDEGELINYVIKIKNDSKVAVSKFKITDYLPEYTTLATASYIKNGVEANILSNKDNQLVLTTNLKNEEITIKIALKVDNLPNDIEEAEIENKIEISGKNMDTQIISVSKFTVINNMHNNEEEQEPDYGGEDNGNNNNNKPDNEEDDGNGNIDNETPKYDIEEDGSVSYKIKGSAWIDENKNGKREDTEMFMQGVQVYLLNENGTLVIDKNGQAKIATTDLNGNYQFNGLQPGRYLVIFVYDNINYELTEYRKSYVINDRNSDAKLTEINFNGQIVEGAVTNIIEIKKTSFYGIDIGLKSKPVFELKLEKQISKVIVKTAKGETVHNYTNEKIMKEEIKSKELKNAQVVIEYKIKITNIGDIGGYVNKIVDIKPTDINFHSELNTDWYEGNDGNLYTIALSNQLIEPGKTEEITLIGIKQMTEENVGTITNNARIEQSYNDKAIAEKNTNDNQDSVQLIVTISTGEPIFYAIGLLMLLIVISSITILLRKGKLKKKKEVII